MNASTVNQWITLVETQTFIKRAGKIFTPSELDELKDFLAENPEAGDIIKGSGGIRKVRIAANQKGKSGGARVIYYFYNPSIPLFLLDVYAKSEKSTLTQADLTLLNQLVHHLRGHYDY